MYQVNRVEVVMVAIDLDKPFALGFGTLKTLPRVFLKLFSQAGGKVIEGVGEASIDFPFSHYDAWDIYHVLSGLNLEGRLLEDKRVILRELSSGQLSEFPAALTAVNMALDDLFGRLNGISILDLYGQKRSGGRCLVSIPYLGKDQLLSDLDAVLKRGSTPKLKAGQGVEEDLALILVLEKSLGGVDRYVLDFNASYRLGQFMELLERLRQQGCALRQAWWLEQPTSVSEGISGLVKAKEALKDSGIRVMADESFISVDDAVSCLQSGLLLNFKIQKIGGIVASIEIEKLTQGWLTESMVGGTFPTAIGRVYDQQAAAVLSSVTLPSDGWQPATDWFSDDKHFMVEDFQFDKDTRTSQPIRGPGLGITVCWEKLAKFVISDPLAEYRCVRYDRPGSRIKIELRDHASYLRTYQALTGRSADWNL